MPNSSRITRLATGLFAAGLVAFSSFVFVEQADAARRRRRRGRNLAVQRINVDRASGIPGNLVIEAVFTAQLDASTVGSATFQIREQNATQTGYTKQVFGEFQVAGRIVRWYPRLPGHLRDPADPEGGFYRQGTARDDATANAGLKPSKSYQVSLLGRDSFSPLRSTRGRPLRRTRRATFATASATALKDLYTTTTYVDAPPPQFSFSNPIDRVPTPTDQYAIRGGAQDVPNDLAVSLFCTRVPLSPGTARVLGNVTLTILERKGNKSVRRPIVGSVFVEQNFTTTLLLFSPRFDLADLGVYALRVTKNVKDLTEEFDFAPNRERERLRAIYDWLAAARQAEILGGNPNPDPTTLGDPPAQLISDWPADAATRGVLKANVLALGDNDPDEIDPRVMVLFSTRDEPVSEDRAILDFDRSDSLFDGNLSTGQWDQDVPSAASAIRTIAGGSAANGDFFPTADTPLNMNSYPGGEANFRDVDIAQGVTVTVTGDRPALINAINFTLNGTIRANGANGNNGGRKSGTRPLGGAGGPGGGDGGDAATSFNNARSSPDNTKGIGEDGSPGVASDGVAAGSDEGGQGGEGGATGGNGTAYRFGSGGGGGGAREDGQTGQSAAWPTSTSWSAGPPGKGGAGAGDAADELDPLVGGAGGGAGANQAWGTSSSQQYYGGSGGGGGGAIRIQVARIVNIGSTGIIEARGGNGARGNNGATSSQSGGGGAGGGGSILLRSGLGFNIADAGNAFNVDGGVRSNYNSTATANGGNGGSGYIRLEDASGGMDVPGGTSGVFDPEGGGVPSYVYSRYLDLGVQGRILEFANDEINTVTSNDAIYIEMQMTREDPSIFGQPDLSAIDESPTTDIFAAQGTLDESVTSPWVPLKLHDATGGRAFPSIAYDPTVPGNPDEVTFEVGDVLNGHNYRFVRYRIFFQLDENHGGADSPPYVGFITIRFQFNF